ncbi:MAG: hypothetical protein RIT26_1650 [Pseudomonadota bacterium]
MLTELLLAILISALLAANTVVQTNQTTNETAAIAVGAYLTSVAGAVARFAQANGGAAPGGLNVLSTPGGLGLGSNIPAGNGTPVIGVRDIVTGSAAGTISSTVAYACTPQPMSIRQVNTDAKGRDSLVNLAILSMAGGGARSYSANPNVIFGAFGRLDLGTTVVGGNGILCAWKNVYNADLMKPVKTDGSANSLACGALNTYQIVFSSTARIPVYCNGFNQWKGLNEPP